MVSPYNCHFYVNTETQSMRENNNINYLCLGERRGQINNVIVIRNFNCENISVIVLSQRLKAKTAILKQVQNGYRFLVSRKCSRSHYFEQLPG